jgi:hypothetical protein
MAGFTRRLVGNNIDMTAISILASSSTGIVVLLIVLVVALIVGLAFVMSRPRDLAPHRAGITGNRWRLRRRPWQLRAERALEREEAEQQSGTTTTP